MTAANPADDANGKTVVFESTSNLADPPSTRCTQALPTRRIFRAQQVKGQFAYDELTGGLNPAADCSNAVITAEGFRVAFQCVGDLRGNGSTGTNVYLWRNDQVCDFQSNPPCSDVQQIPDTVGGDFVTDNPSFNLLSTMIVFDSNAPIDGNTNGSQQIWLYDIKTNPPFDDAHPADQRRREQHAPDHEPGRAAGGLAVDGGPPRHRVDRLADIPARPRGRHPAAAHERRG